MKAIRESQKSYFLTGATKSYDFRLTQLKKLKKAIVDNQDKVLQALQHDLHKSVEEGFISEVGFVISSLTIAIKKLNKWMRTKKVKTPLFQIGSQSFITPEPYGQVLIIGPFNYPFQLVIEPLIGAIAAGNTVVIKPSELAVHTESILKELIRTTFEENYIAVVTGNALVTTEILSLKWDHIFFTGSPRVGKIVYEAASHHLTPVVLELGGKNPTIVDPSANLEVAARRIVFGKFMNAGQTCIATDYIYVHQSVKDHLLKELVKSIKQFYPPEVPYGAIIHDRHYQRLLGLVDDKKVVYRHQVPSDSRTIPPTIIDNITWQDKIMEEEIFGPLLPVLTYDNLDEMLDLINTKEKSLAVYLFTENTEIEKKVWSRLSFGNGAINDTLMQVANPNLPFGGVGNSGMGAYHGQTTFDIFSHYKSYQKRSTRIDLPLAYPPYTKNKMKIIKNFFK